MKKKNYLTVLFLLLFLTTQAQPRFPWQRKTEKKEVKTELANKPAPPASNKDLKSFNQIITKGYKKTVGLFTTYKADDKYYFEIPDSIFGRDLLIVSRISKAAADKRAMMLGYAGDEINENVIRLEKKNNKIFLKTISYSERSQDTLGMYKSVLNSNIQPISAAFDIKTYHNDSLKQIKNPLIDVTDFLNGDNNVFFFDSRLKRALAIGNLFPDRSYIDTIKAYPLNVEIRTVKTYSQTSQNPAASPSEPLTYELNSSIVLLPKEPMKPRYKDERVAYFATSYTDFDANPQGVKDIAMITRWRLEPKEEDVEKYKRGELVEPKKPIVYYIDPATPKKWVPYLKAGVNDWQKAFEQAGFKNAIYAVEVSSKDSTWSIDDARHSAIVYKPSDIPNASGPHVHDPRSGEIIESHINWYHNVMQLLHDWYFVQAAAIDPRARKVEFDDELMGQLIRFVSSHEVGHTLGLRHNFGSSATVPVEKLRDKAWVEANGHTPSIMDYARFNYVAQPEDNVGESGIFPRIGIYDKWSIEWGYKWMPEFATPKDEVPTLNKMVLEKLKEDKRYTFGTESDRNDPRNQSEDLGDNAMKASEYGIKNLKRIVPNLLSWTYQPNEDLSMAKNMYAQIATQFARYMGHVSKNVAGIYTTPRKVEENAPISEYVPASIQREAMAFLNKQLFITPSWLINQELIKKANVDPVATISKIQSQVLSRLQSDETISKLVAFENQDGTKAYTILDLYADLSKSIWPELTSGANIDLYHRKLQKSYIENLKKLIKKDNADSSNNRPLTMLGGGQGSEDASTVARAQLTKLRTNIRVALPASKGLSHYHLEDCLAQINTILDNKK
jgi:hypothetical protein